MRTEIMVPPFVYQTQCPNRCTECGATHSQTSIVAAGVEYDRDNDRTCFFYKVRCNCGNIDLVKCTSRLIERPDWWEAIAEWNRQYAATKPTLGMNYIAPMTGVNLLLRTRGVHKLQIFGGYKGDVGPVILLYRRVGSRPLCTYALLRLEKDDRVLMENVPYSESLPVDRWPWFLSRPAGMQFDHAYKFYTKLSDEEVVAIVQDRVFSPVKASDKTEKA